MTKLSKARENSFFKPCLAACSTTLILKEFHSWFQMKQTWPLPFPKWMLSFMNHGLLTISGKILSFSWDCQAFSKLWISQGLKSSAIFPFISFVIFCSFVQSQGASYLENCCCHLKLLSFFFRVCGCNALRVITLG